MVPAAHHAAEAAEKLIAAAAMAMTITAARAGRGSGTGRRRWGRSFARIAREEARQLAAESVAKR